MLESHVAKVPRFTPAVGNGNSQSAFGGAPTQLLPRHLSAGGFGKKVLGLASSAQGNVLTGEEKPWLLKDLRKTCATHYTNTSLSRRSRYSAIPWAVLPIAMMGNVVRWRSRQS